MKDAMQIFTVGLGGVFIGMALLYITIRLTRIVAERLSTRTTPTAAGPSPPLAPEACLSRNCWILRFPESSPEAT